MTSDNEQEMREAFEKYCESISLPLDAYPSAIRKHTNSYYVNSNTEKAWLAWQAAIAAYEGALKHKVDQLTREREGLLEWLDTQDMVHATIVKMQLTQNQTSQGG